jgi:phage terminase small subunit
MTAPTARPKRLTAAQCEAVIERGPDIAHLSADAQATWHQINGEFELSHRHQLILLRGLEHWDLAGRMLRQIDAEGVTVTDRYGSSKPSPAVAIARDATRIWQSALRELLLDAEQPTTPRAPSRWRT